MLVLGDRPHPLVLATLVPIIGGVGIASLSEVSAWAEGEGVEHPRVSLCKGVPCHGYKQAPAPALG